MAVLVRVSEIQHEGNGQRDHGDLRRLAGSIQEHGIKVPLCVYRRNGGYRLIDGGDRLEAAKMVGLAEVPAEVVDEPEETERAIRHVMSRVRSGALDAVDRAREYSKLVDLGCSQEQIAGWLGMNPATISQEMGLLRLIPELQEAVKGGRLATRAGYHLSHLSATQQRESADRALAAKSTRRVESIVRRIKGEVRDPQPPVVEDAKSAEKRLSVLRDQLPVPGSVRDELEPTLMGIEAMMKEIWRLM